MSNDAALVERARRVIPGAMYGHMSVQRMMPPGYPQFFERADGCRLWDSDGNEYLDFMCAYGPMIVGYRHPAVEAAVDAQRRRLDIATGPAPVMVELAEAFVSRIAHAEWAIFGKNGTDATTLCLTLARAGTGRRKILVAEHAYHGAAPWCTPLPAGVVDGDRAHLVQYRYNDADSLRAAAASVAGDLAGIVVSAFKHDAFADQELPTPAFANAARRIADDADAALILDEVRAGFRLSRDTSWSHLGVAPDLSAWSKAIANGYPLAAVLGNERFRKAATRVYTTGSFWYEAAPMAASLATLEVLEASDTPAHLERLGSRLRDGLAEQAGRHGVGLRQTGPVQMPMVLFEDDADLDRGRRFCAAALTHGVYLHPWHNMFLSLAHTDADIDRALAATEAAFATLG